MMIQYITLKELLQCIGDALKTIEASVAMLLYHSGGYILHSANITQREWGVDIKTFML